MEKTSRKIAYHPEFRHISGSAAAAILLSQYWYWSQNSKAIKRGGEFYKTAAEICEETGLSRSEYETALKRLIKAGLIKKTRKGWTNKTWIKLDLLKLICELGKLKSALMDSVKALLEHGTKAAVKAAEMAKKVFSGSNDARTAAAELPDIEYCADDFADCVQLIKSFAGYIERCASEDKKETLVKLFRQHGLNHNYVKKTWKSQLKQMKAWSKKSTSKYADYFEMDLREYSTDEWQKACEIKPGGTSA